MSQTTTTTSAGVHWDLTPLFADADAARAALPGLTEASSAFRERYRGRVATLPAAELATALDELAALDNSLSRLASYSGLRLTTNVNGEAERDLNAAVEMGLVEIQNLLRFFELEWIGADEEHAQQVLADPLVAENRHYLASSRRFAPHTRSEPEEEMLGERDPAAAGAWHTLFDQVTSTLRIPFEGEDRTIDEVLARVRGPVRETRLAAYDALFTALEPQAGVLAHVYDSLVADRLVLDRVRGYTHPRESRDLDNELPSKAVDVLLAAVERHHRLAHRWFRHKAKLLGLDKLSLGDQYAPLGSTRPVAYDDAMSLVEQALDDFSPRIGDVARGLYRDHRIDAEPRQGKRGGAFCASIAQDALPYVMLNFTDQMDDVRTIAHEIGHAMQFQLAGERQTALSHHPPLALAEVPSTFAEMIVTDRLLAAAADDTRVRLGLLASGVETAFATVFRQTHMVRYEQGAYGLRAEGKALLPDRLGEIWLATNRPYYGDAVELPQGYRLGWAYIPHFIHTRFYTYAYVFAHLASLALSAKYREDGDAFVGPYLDFLAIGGAASPQEQLASIGLDITRDDCWDAGFAEIERLIELAEAIEPDA
ncbi:MAG: oligoendopeptidase [Gaiellales bacterium]|jgi:oligoendopeptidase F|nr:oligoendopeptidase [Gaiellales bacterium]